MAQIDEQLEELKELGINVEDAVQRFMGNKELFLRMLGKLPQSIKNLNINPDFDDADIEQVITDTHTVKGVTGNLSVTPLYTAYTKIVDLLRADKPEEARQTLKDILPVQEKIIACIEDLLPDLSNR